MDNGRVGGLATYDVVSPGYEAWYRDEATITQRDLENKDLTFGRDESGNAYEKWPIWTCTGVHMDWDAGIKQVNRMQENLGVLDDETRRIRIHIGSLAHCDSGFPVTVDELLAAIGKGRLDGPPFHNGCYQCTSSKSTQPYHTESMQTVEAILESRLRGKAREEVLEEFPYAEGFINRTYEWLPPEAKMTGLQKLMMERTQLPFEYLSGRNPDYVSVCKNFFRAGRGVEIDAEISEMEGLPEIHPNFTQAFRDNLGAIEDPRKKEIYWICGGLAHGLHELSDCHHSTFRWIERWIHAIGTLRWDMPSRRAGTERQRLGRLLFGYVLGLDKWLVGNPMQFLLLDLGHADLGFDPKNEILRVYAYLGEERTAVKEWLAACLWVHMYHSLRRWNIHKALVERGTGAGIDVREWMDAALGSASGPG